MKNIASQKRLSDDIDVLRVKKYSPINYTKETIPSRPPPNLFDLSSEDKEEGKRRGQEPLLSVWQSTISKKQLFENRNIMKGDLPAVYKLSVGEIHAIEVQPMHGMNNPLEVFNDPDESILSGHLHAGIKGLDRKKGIEKKFYKNLKHELVKRSILKY